MLLAAGAVALRASGVELSPEQVVATVRRLSAEAVGPPLYVALYFVGTALFLPAAMFHVAAGGLWGFWPGVAWACLAMNVVSNLQFWGGKVFGAGPIGAFLARRGLGRVFEHSRTEGPWLMVFVRQLPLPFVAVNVAAGASGMRWWHFMLGSGVGGTAPLLVWTYFAAQLLHDHDVSRAAVFGRALLAGAGVVVLALGSRWLARRVRSSGSSVRPPP